MFSYPHGPSPSRSCGWLILRPAEVRRFDGLLHLNTDPGFFAEVAVTVEASRLADSPVLDNKNRPILAPSASISTRASSAAW